ncbi:AAA family ATPase [Vibrio hannami]|uniref:AAA family ATPase n=1 Tax=Vibrio hannami TaxID=2717094 RepID=UPI002410AE54|nr:AAA family ATPase [Vibrio hannami]MDG3087333.1 AAA family ATPase [Vibrio hannami]
MGEAVKLGLDDQSNYKIKTNLCIWLVYASERYLNHMNAELGKCGNLNVETISLSIFNADGIDGFAAPDLVFIETGVNWAKKLVDLQEQDATLQDHEASLIVFGDEQDTGALKIALRLGASDFLSYRASIDELMPLLKNTAEEKIVNRNLGDLCLFINTKGGSGATTLAVNMAIEIAQSHSKKVILVDLDLQFGATPDYLDMKPRFGISDALESINDLDEVSLPSMVSSHESGLDLIGYTSYGSHENYSLARNFGKLLPILRQFYDYVIVDLSRGIEHFYAPLIAPASRVYLVSQQNLISIKHTSELIRVLQLEYGINKDSVEIILNRYEKSVPVNLKDIQNTIENVEIHMVPNDYKVAVESANLGNPIVLSSKKSAIAKSIVSIANNLDPTKTETKGFFARLFS